MRAFRFAALLLVIPLLGASSVPGTLRISPESRLWVDGTSTLRDWRCEATRVDGGARITTTAGELRLAMLQNTVTDVYVAVPTALLECGNGRMNDHMWKALGTREHPFVRYRHGKHVVKTGTDGAVQVSTEGWLTIQGATQPVRLTATATRDQGRLVLRGLHSLRMTDYGVQPPTLMMGTLKVGDEVTIGFEVVLE